MLIFIGALTVNETTQCFKPQSQLLGRKASNILSLTLSPKTELSTFCQSLNGETATIKLFIQNVQDSLIPTSSQVVLNMSEQEITFMFQLVPATNSNGQQLTPAQIYDEINSQSFAEYNISVLNIELTGTVETMVFNTKDARNCWDNVTMQYIAITGKESIQINTTPLSCAIPNIVNVTFQYMTSTDYDWITVQLIPSPAGSPPGFYTSNTSFNHLSTKIYNQTAAGYQNPANKQKFLDMFKNFRNNRDIQFKMVLQTIANSISTQYYVYITNWTSVSGDCFDNYFIYQSIKSLTFSMEGNATCPGVTEAQYINGSVLVTGGTKNYQNSIQVKGNYFQTAKFLRYIFEEPWTLNTTRLHFYTYLTYYNQSASGDITVITELTRFGIVTKSCFGEINLRLDNGQVCMNINIWDYNITNETSQYNCLARFNNFDSHQKLELYFEKQFLDIQTRNYTFYTYFSTPKATSNIIDFCFTESPPIQPIVPGNFLQRSLLQVKKLHQLGNKLACGIFLNENTVYYIDTVVLQPTPLDQAWVFVPALVALGIFGLFLFFTLRQK